MKYLQGYYIEDYKRTHPWLTFVANLKAIPWNLCALLGECQSKCEHIRDAPILPDRAGYEVGRYISLEKVIESHREGYYESLLLSSQGWHEGNHSPLSWWNYFLGVVLIGAYRELESRMDIMESGKGGKSALILDAVSHMIGDFSVSEIRNRCPGVGIDLIRKILRQEKDEGRLECLNYGPHARWRRI